MSRIRPLLLLASLVLAAPAWAGSREHVVPLPADQEADWAFQLRKGPAMVAAEPVVLGPKPLFGRREPITIVAPGVVPPLVDVRSDAGYVPPPRQGLLQVLLGPKQAYVHVPAPVPDPRSWRRPTAPRGHAVAPRRAAAPRAIAPKFLPTVVSYETSRKPGTVVIDTSARHLYLVLPEGKAKRYGIGVGREGFSWVGTVKVGRKAEWPGWTPPPEMLERRPDLPRHMEGGPANPLGARALYLYKGGSDTLFRIHGSNEPWTIGQAVSSGCIRMRNEDVIDLYGRVGVGATVVVL